MFEKFYDYYTPKGERNYIIKKKIDTEKDLESIIKENIKNFRNPLTPQEFVENQILLDYIISEKYKNNNTIYDKIYRKINKEHPEKKKILSFCKNNKVNIYFDKSIDADLCGCLEKYYYNQNTLKKKLRIKLEINENILNNPKKIDSIIEKIVEKLSEITKIPLKNLCVTNIRKNCLIFDIFIIVIDWARNIINNNIEYIRNEINNSIDSFRNVINNYIDSLINFFASSASRRNRHRDEFIRFLRQIENENGNIRIREVDGNEYPDDYRVQIQDIIHNFVINPNNDIFDSTYDKEKGQFGHVFSFFYKESKIKNERIYYYPNRNCEGYGIKINREDIFSPIGNNWCTVYTNLLKNEFSFRLMELEEI